MSEHNNEMTIEEFKEIALKDLDRFVQMYKEGMESNVDHYPKKLPEGDWFEQFVMFQTLES